MHKYPDLVTDNTKTDHYYYLNIDKETTVKISHDYSLTGIGDMIIETPLKPFVDAGLDVTKLDDTTNDKDIVFILYAAPLKDLGVNVNTIEGWTFMTVENPDGSGTDILVKPFNLDPK